MKYRKISMNAGGTKGAEVHFLEANEKNLMELTKKYPRNPCHLGMQKLFKDLRPHLLNICGFTHDAMDENIVKQHIKETDVFCIELDGTNIVLHGEKLATTEKYIGLKSYKLEAEDGYEHYDEVFGIVNAICDETTEYMRGNKKATDEEAMLQWAEQKGYVKVKENGKARNVPFDELKEFSPEKLKEWASNLLENDYGSIVLHSDDIDHSDLDVAGAVEELKTEFEIKEGEDEIAVAEVKEEKPKKNKKDAHSPVTEEEQF